MKTLWISILFIVFQINTCKMRDYEHIFKKPVKISTILKFIPQKIEKVTIIRDIMKEFKVLADFETLYPRTLNKSRGFMSDREIVALTLWTEARGEGFKGIKAVASVIMNRLNVKQFRSLKTIRNICLQPFQFSAWNENITPSLVIQNENDYKTWCYCLMVADDMLKGCFKPIISSTHYYAFKKCKPSWYNMKRVVYIGNHKFGIA